MSLLFKILVRPAETPFCSCVQRSQRQSGRRGWQSTRPREDRVLRAHGCPCPWLCREALREPPPGSTVTLEVPGGGWGLRGRLTFITVRHCFPAQIITNNACVLTVAAVVSSNLFDAVGQGLLASCALDVVHMDGSLPFPEVRHGPRSRRTPEKQHVFEGVGSQPYL